MNRGTGVAQNSLQLKNYLSCLLKLVWNSCELLYARKEASTTLVDSAKDPIHIYVNFAALDLLNSFINFEILRKRLDFLSIFGDMLRIELS